MAEATTRVLGIAGSLRAGSFNRMLLNNAVRLAPEGMTIETFDIRHLPLFDQDLEAQELPQSVQDLHSAIRAVDAILFVTPEYNYGVPGVLKNALDWASRPPRQSPIYGKPAAVMGASMGMGGTARAQLQLRHNFFFLNMPAVLQPEVLVGHAHQKFDEEGNLLDEMAQKLITQHLEALIELVNRYRS